MPSISCSLYGIPVKNWCHFVIYIICLLIYRRANPTQNPAHNTDYWQLGLWQGIVQNDFNKNNLKRRRSLVNQQAMVRQAVGTCGGNPWRGQSRKHSASEKTWLTAPACVLTQAGWEQLRLEMPWHREEKREKKMYLGHCSPSYSPLPPGAQPRSEDKAVPIDAIGVAF